MMPVREDIEGLEIYRGRFEPVPGYWPSDCGMIFVWRKPDWGNPFQWSTLILAGVLGALAWALVSLIGG